MGFSEELSTKYICTEITFSQLATLSALRIQREFGYFALMKPNLSQYNLFGLEFS